LIISFSRKARTVEKRRSSNLVIKKADDSAVSPTEWHAIQAELRTTYQRVKTLANSKQNWESEDEVDGIISIIVHTAYHLGEIRQALCFLRGF